MTASISTDYPDFLCVGAQKAGTTWLHAQLKQHPHVWFPHVKEVHYFDSMHLGQKINMAVAGAVKRLEHLSKKASPSSRSLDYFQAIVDLPMNDAWYAHVFSKGAGRIRGEITPNYCMIGEEGVAHVKRVAPSARIIYLIRDPVSRMISSLQMAVKRGSAIDISFVRRPVFQGRGDYAAHVPVWDHVFGSSVLYVPFGDIRTQPRNVLRRIEEFIGLKHFDGYANSEDAVHVGRKVAIDDEIIEEVHRACVSQYEFLSGRFGDDFLRRTK